MFRQSLSFSWLLVVFAVSLATHTSGSETITITDVSSFREFIETMKTTHDEEMNVVLECDVDLTSNNILTLPIGADFGGGCIPFSGTFDGQNHKVKGISTATALYSGLFCKLENATVKNLFLESSGISGYISGILSAGASANLTLVNVHTTGIVHFSSAGGGLIGNADLMNLHAFNCSFHGEMLFVDCTDCDLSEGSRGGGLFGKINMQGNATLINCEHYGSLSNPSSKTKSLIMGGLVGLFTEQQKYFEDVSITLISCSQVGDITCSCIENCVIGGLFGENDMLISKVSVTIQQCSTFGNITTTDTETDYIGGFLGSLRADTDIDGCSFVIERCHCGSHLKSGTDPNSQCRKNRIEGCFGGFVGLFSTVDALVVFRVNYSLFNGTLEVSDGTSANVGGYLGIVNSEDDGSKVFVSFSNDINRGDIFASYIFEYCNIGGFIGRSQLRKQGTLDIAFFNSTNFGNIAVTAPKLAESRVAGFYGLASEEHIATIKIEGCRNEGNITITGPGEFYAGGFIGETNIFRRFEIKLERDINNGNIEECSENSVVHASGLVGAVNVDKLTENSSVTASECINFGSINISSVEGAGETEPYCCGLIGFLDKEIDGNCTIASCMNSGNITCLNANAFGIASSGLDKLKVYNTVNKGSTRGLVVYAIADSIADADNVAIIGDVKGNNTSVTKMWNKASRIENIYSLDGMCSDEEKIYCLKRNNGIFSAKGQELATLMTNEAIIKQYSIGWSKGMEMEAFIKVNFIGKANKTVFFKSGSKASDSPLPTWVDEFKFVSKGDETVFSKSMTINKEWRFVGMCEVIVNVFGKETKKEVEFWTPLNELDELSMYWNDDYIVRDKNNKSVSYKKDGYVEGNMDCIVVHNCAKIQDKEHCGMTEECKWVNDGCHEKEEKGGLGGGAIAGIVICVVVVVVSALMVVGLLMLLKKRNEEGEGKKEIEMGKRQEETRMEEMIVLRVKGKEERIRMKEEIGSGAYGRVWSGIGMDGVMYGVKVVESENIEAKKKAREEAEMMEKLDNKYIARVYGCLETEKCLYTVMELFEMGSLDTVLQGRGLGPELRMPILLEIGLGMEYLHGQGIIHRDLKPGNVLVRTLDPSSPPMCKFVSSFSLHSHISLIS